MDDQGVPPGPVRARVLRLRRRVGRTGPGRALKLALGRERSIPSRTEPDRRTLAAYSSEPELPVAIEDGSILDDAVAWRDRVGLREATERTLPVGQVGRNGPSGSIRNVVLVSHCDFRGN